MPESRQLSEGYKFGELRSFGELFSEGLKMSAAARVKEFSEFVVAG